MATFTLTTNADAFTGGAANDVFAGPGGGTDTLLGGAGIDRFNIEAGQKGLIDGGLGIDRITMVGAANDTLDPALTITNVEQLVVTANEIFASVNQLKGFSSIVSTSASTDFTMHLRSGGTLDLSTSYVDSQRLTIDAELSTSAVTAIGSARNDEFFGSDYNDKFNGGGGNDTVRGGAGTDILNGGIGRDFLEGSDGLDAFLFDTALGTSNIDHIMDFRTQDDHIRLDNSVFAELTTTGKLAANLFKDLGVGAQDADDRILYNSDKGFLFYDADGLGGNGPVLFAILDNFSGDVPLLFSHDIFVV